MERQPKPEDIRESSPFPITKEAADRALGEFAEDTDKVLKQESDTLVQQNSALNGLINRTARTLGRVEAVEYIEAAALTYRTIRIQSEIIGGRLPRISQEAVDMFPRDRLNEAKQQLKSTGKVLSFREYCMELGEQLMNEQPELGNAIGEITKYRPTKENYYRGASDVYSLFKGFAETQELERKIGF